MRRFAVVALLLLFGCDGKPENPNPNDVVLYRAVSEGDRVPFFVVALRDGRAWMVIGSDDQTQHMRVWTRTGSDPWDEVAPPVRIPK